MPTYLYECEEHGEFEIEHSLKEKLTLCPLCEEEGKEPKKIKRLICPGGSFILTGSGWARDNYS